MVMDEIRLNKGLLIGGIILGGLLLSVWLSPVIAWASIAAITIGTLLLGHPSVALGTLFVWSLLEPTVKLYAWNVAIKSIDEGFIALCIAIVGYTLFIRRRLREETRVFFRFALFLAFFGMGSLLVNKGSVVSLINFYSSYWGFMVTFPVAYYFGRNLSFKKFITAIDIFFLIQAVMNFGWLFGFNPLRNEHAYDLDLNTADFAKGLLGSSAFFAYFTGAYIFLLFSRLRIPKENRLWLTALLLLAGVQFYICYASHAYLYLGLLFLGYIAVRRFPLQRIVSFACLGVLLVGLMAFADQWMVSTGKTGGGKGTIYALTDPSIRRQRWKTFTRSPKITLMERVVVHDIGASPLQWCVGHSPGNGACNIARSRLSGAVLDYLLEYYATFSGAASHHGSVLEDPGSAVLSMWTSVGVVGMFVWIGLYLYVLKKIMGQIRRREYGDPYQQALAEGFVMALMMFLITNTLRDTLDTRSFQVGLWWWAAYVWDPKQIPQLSSNEELNDEKK